MTSSTSVIVLDNGGATIKLGISCDHNPTTISPNCTARTTTSKKKPHTLTSDEITTADPTSLTHLRRPLDRCHLTNPNLQRDIWSHLLTAHLPDHPHHDSHIEKKARRAFR
ncbi:hypothetical protein vseg_000936 [Gypsophila vaccaria]